MVSHSKWSDIRRQRLETAPITDWEGHMRSLLGRRVEVTIATEPDIVKVTGMLHYFTTDFGEVCVVDDETGETRWAWPNLAARELVTQLVCPECGDAAEEMSPEDWRVPGETPGHRHVVDRTALCPVMTDSGYRPAVPVERDV